MVATETSAKSGPAPAKIGGSHHGNWSLALGIFIALYTVLTMYWFFNLKTKTADLEEELKSLQKSLQEQEDLIHYFTVKKDFKWFAPSRLRRGMNGDREDDMISCFVCPPGPLGPKGDKGDEGPRGKRGRRGITGKQGSRGAPAPHGKTGRRGDSGDIGPPGPPGAKGDVGEKGDIGHQGLKGEMGLRGLPGPQGPRGATGSHTISEIQTTPQAIHLQGNSAHKFPSLMRLDSTGILKNWQINSNTGGFTLLGNGNVTVAERGQYFIYSNILFYDDNAFYGAHTTINGIPFLTCSGMRAKASLKFGTCYSSGVTVLQAQDMVGIRSVYPYRMVDVHKESTYFGIIKL